MGLVSMSKEDFIARMQYDREMRALETGEVEAVDFNAVGYLEELRALAVQDGIDLY